MTKPIRTVALLLILLAAFLPASLVQGQDDATDSVPESDRTSAVEDGQTQDAQEADVELAKDWTESINASLDRVLGDINAIAGKYLMFDLSFGIFDYRDTDQATGEEQLVEVNTPFLVVFLALGAIFFTLWHGFINLRGFAHAWKIVFGKYAHDTDEGDLPPFRALTSALSATVGLGNIANVALAMVIGGPGALFWMMFLGLFGMCAKFHESTLAQMFRTKNPDGTISGGPMYYLERGLKSINPALAGPGKALAIMFSVFCVFAALGGGNMFQANQAFEGFFSTFIEPSINADQIDRVKALSGFGFGLLMAALVAVVVLGGITRIGATTARIVPFMALIYVLACSTIIIVNINALPALMVEVLSQAFNADAAFGGFIGAMMMGFTRAAFSSEAGLGSSAIAHAAARTDHPVREGFVASLEPFIDTIVICFLTGTAVLITNAYKEAEGGSAVTVYAFRQVGVLESWFPSVLSICIVLFAFSTMISWCYYGERAWGYLFNIKTIVIFRILFVLCVFIGSVASLNAVVTFSEIALLSMAIPNMIGGVILAPMVKRKVADYWKRFRSGQLDGSQPADPGADI